MPDDVEIGTMTVNVVLNYQKLPTPVAEFLGVPKEEAEIMDVNSHKTVIEIVDD